MNLNDDILRGAEAIQGFLGFEKRSQIYHYVATGEIPVFRIGNTICARKSTLLKWIEQQEQAAQAGASKSGTA